MTDEPYNAYDKNGRFIDSFATQAEADAAVGLANELVRAEEAEEAAENALLRAKPTEQDRQHAKALGPGLHLRVEQPPSRGRSSVIFRGIWSMPYVVVAFVQLVIAVPITTVSWFSILLSGEYPRVLFAYNVQMVRYLVRTTGYVLLVTDARPPLDGASNPLYPIQVDVNPAESYDRLLVALRLPLLIPLGVLYTFTLILALISFTVSIPIVRLTRHQPRALQAAALLFLRVYAQFLASATLLTSDWWLAAPQRLQPAEEPDPA